MAKYARAKLTIDRIERLAPGEIVMDTDEPGLGVRRQGKARVFFIRRYRAGRRHFLTIGEYGVAGLTVSAARDKAKRLIAAINDGFSPAEARARERSMPTVSQLADDWLRHHVEAKLKPKTQELYRSTLRTSVLPAIGSIRVDKVTSDLLQRMHHSARSRPYAANRALAIASKLLGFAERCGFRKPGTNPVRGIERFREEKRERFLTQDELVRLGSALADAETAARHSPHAIAAIKLLLLTGMRMNEALKLRWAEVDLERGLINLLDSKTGRKSVILGTAAHELLRDLPRTSSDFVFPGAKPNAPLEGLRKVWATVTDKAGLTGLRIHDLRHTFAAVSASSGGSLPMIGRLLGHAQPATTARYAHLAADPVRDLADRSARTISDALQSSQKTVSPSEKTRS